MAGTESASVFCMGTGLLFGAGAGWFMGDGGRGRVTSSIFDEWQVDTMLADLKALAAAFPERREKPAGDTEATSLCFSQSAISQRMDGAEGQLVVAGYLDALQDMC